jgi:hypothetical protein
LICLEKESTEKHKGDINNSNKLSKCDNIVICKEVQNLAKDTSDNEVEEVPMNQLATNRTNKSHLVNKHDWHSMNQ